MELELGLALPSSDLMMEKSTFCKKRRFDEVLDENTVTLPLFMQREEDSDSDRGFERSSEELNFNSSCICIRRSSLIMRCITEEEDGGYNSYKVTYEDEEGDWMLVGDVPWEAFIKSAKRLKIITC
ncbi:hypothetical protein ZIOFF_067006 [Zingiber officinale]|uniref:Auxin-responsive protein n=1 Tax=Zingiber officinale TaxID=94328 RepID=A0A8J5CEV4_ZINOF|nr:hypothetical protein ZIOFF_067006 [Zingiber officinale]